MDPDPVPEPSSQALEPDASVSAPPWRRAMLVTAGLSLLAAGVVLNADRLRLPGRMPEPLELDGGAISTVQQRSVAFKAGGQGRRHRGEEGKMGRPSAKTKSGLYAMRGPMAAARQLGVIPGGLTGGLTGSRARERYAELAPADFIATSSDPRSTFSVDVDTAAYANVRRFLLETGQAPPPGAVRTEEMINYFDYDYDYAQPSGDSPFSVTTEVGPAPWDHSHRVVHIGVQGKAVDAAQIPPRNLVFLIDVSGSMSGPDRLGLIETGLAALARQMNGRDRISLVAYAGAAGIVLPPTSGAEHRTIVEALERLGSGGGTNGAAGIHLAYELAQRAFIDGGINRVLIATDGDFNVGTHDHAELMKLVEAKRETGVSLSVLGVGTGNLNDHLMEQLADRGNGNYAYIDGELEARKVLVEESGAMLQTIAEDVKIQVEFDGDRVAEHRLIGYENRILAHRDFDDDRKDAGEIGAGHTVTALFEIVLVPGADEGPLMSLDLRYKDPGGERSRTISAPVVDDGRGLADASDDYRFSAAVAMLGQTLRHDARGRMDYAEIARLAKSALGSDPHCYRHQFLELVAAAGDIAGEPIGVAVPACRPAPPRPAAVADETVEEREPFDWSGFALEVLRLLPPLLALPVFVLAFRRPRRRPRVR